MMINFSRLNRLPNFFQNWLCTGKWVRRLKSWFKYNDLDLQHCLVHIIAWYSVQRTCGVEFSQIFLGQHHQVGIVRPATVPIIFYSRFLVWPNSLTCYLLGSSQKTALLPLALALFTASFTQSCTNQELSLLLNYLLSESRKPQKTVWPDTGYYCRYPARYSAFFTLNKFVKIGHVPHCLKNVCTS